MHRAFLESRSNTSLYLLLVAKNIIVLTTSSHLNEPCLMQAVITKLVIPLSRSLTANVLHE